MFPMMNATERDQHDRFLRLYVAHEEALRGFVRSLVPTLEDAREVMQEVAAVLWRKADHLPPADDFRRWAFGVARLEALDFLRTRRRDRHVFSDAFLLTLADESIGAGDSFERERIALAACLQRLPTSRRELIEAAYAPGVRIDSLAARLGRTPMAVYKSLHRIRMALLACTERHLSNDALP